MKHEIVIETQRMRDGYFRAYVVKGPTWARGWDADDSVRQCAYLTLRQDLVNMRPGDTFDFVHSEA